MDRSHAPQTRFKDPPIRPGHFKTADERRSLLSFYQRYSYRDGPREGNHNVNGNNSSPPGPSTTLQKVKSHLSADVSTRWADLVLMVCFMVSGLVDSCAYNAYSCFVSMQVSLSIKKKSPINIQQRHLLTTTQTDRKHNLPRPRRQRPPHLHPLPSLDQVPHLHPLLPARRSPDLRLPPHFRRAQTLGARRLLLLPNGRNDHLRNPGALRLLERIASAARRTVRSDEPGNTTRHRIPEHGPCADWSAEFPGCGQGCC